MNYEKPDGAVCMYGLYNVKALNESMREVRNPTDDFIFGKPRWNIRDMYVIWEFKTHITSTDRGTLYKYLTNLSGGDEFNVYTGILGDRDGFVCTTMQKGVVLTNQYSSWVLEGGRDFLLAKLRGFVETNRWVYLLREVCRALQLNVQSFLGNGKFGRCFVVKTNDGQDKALKIVLVANLKEPYAGTVLTGTKAEFASLSGILSMYTNVVRIQPESLTEIFYEGKSIGVGYLMDDVGTQLIANEIRSREALSMILRSLKVLHEGFIYHGDARITNVILHNGAIKWIDFMNSHACTAEWIRRDVRVLLSSVYDNAKIAELDFIPILDGYDATDVAVDRILNYLFPGA
jgi:hypothetical protein